MQTKEEKAAKNREYRMANRENIRVKRKARYLTNREAHKIINHAKYLANRDKRLQANREWFKTHPEATQSIKKKYRLSHHEELLAKGRAYQTQRRKKDPEGARLQQNTYNATHREQLNTYARKRRATHRDLLNAQAKKRRAADPEYDRAWNKAHPEIRRVRQARRRARQYNLPDTFTHTDRAFMLQYWGFACVACGNQEGLWHTLADDHWIPLASPGCPGTVAENMLPLCHGPNGCNNSKGRKKPSIWLSLRFSRAQAKRILIAVDTYFALIRTRLADTNISHAS
jgi:hypothetical protein